MRSENNAQVDTVKRLVRRGSIVVTEISLNWEISIYSNGQDPDTGEVFQYSVCLLHELQEDDAVPMELSTEQVKHDA